MGRQDDVPGAEKAGERFAEDFRLFQGIGWSEYDAREIYALTMPVPELRKLLWRLRDEAAQVLIEHGDEGSRGEGMLQGVALLGGHQKPLRCRFHAGAVAMSTRDIPIGIAWGILDGRRLWVATSSVAEATLYACMQEAQ